MAMEAASRAMEEATRKMEEASRAAALAAEEPPRKRLMTEEDRIMAHPAMPSAHLKITSRSKYWKLTNCTHNVRVWIEISV